MRSDSPVRNATGWWSDRRFLKRFVTDLVAGELSRLRPGWVPAADNAWEDAFRIDLDLGADSLEMMQLATALSQALHLHVAGIEDYLLRRKTIGDWIDTASDGLDHFAADLTFMTSGSTGQPKSCRHSMSSLLQETSVQGTFFKGKSRLLFAVPSHHIYGFIFTILLPQHLGIGAEAMLDLRRRVPSTLSGIVLPGDLVVGYPEFWGAAARGSAQYREDVTGVTSTAPCAADICDRLIDAGMAALVQVYGSSETAGVGWRTDPRGSYELYPFWRADATGTDRLMRTDSEGDVTRVLAPDQFEWVDDRHFSVGKRHDAAVQVGGLNVFPAHVAGILRQHHHVADAAVRLMRPDEGNRLKAYLVLDPSVENSESALEEVRRWVDATLPVAQRPKAFTVGPALPTTVAGKAADWAA